SVARVDVCAAIQQRPDDLRAVVRRGKKERRHALLVSGVRIRAPGQQIRNRGGVALLDGFQESAIQVLRGRGLDRRKGSRNESERERERSYSRPCAMHDRVASHKAKAGALLLCARLSE